MIETSERWAIKTEYGFAEVLGSVLLFATEEKAERYTRLIPAMVVVLGPVRVRVTVEEVEG